uniref:Coiled-coil domain-containing protein 85A n=1 Tax=Panagrolaimus superbus TaxID=310955 RepID=A0A914YZF7_9BILA
MHLNEIRMLKDEIKSLRTNNQQLQDICCFLDEDRQKTRQLSKEWQKFGKYTSDLMKQEITAYQQRIQEHQTRHQQLLLENEELKRLCLYLDEQRQAIISQATAMAEEAAGTQILYGHNDADSSDAGCGSSARSSSDSEREYISSKVEKLGQTTMHLPDPVEFNHEREKALRQLAKTMGNASALEESEDVVVLDQNVAHNDRLFNYIQSLESRIKSLEHQNPGGSSRFSNCSFESNEDLHESHQHLAAASSSRNHSQDPKPLRILSHLSVEDTPPNNTISRQAFCNKMFESTTSTMTSSGTTYCSSETDESAATAVFVMGDEEDQFNHLEVRTLGPIDEETENDSESYVETIVKPLKIGANNHAGNRISSGSEASSSGTSTTAEHADNETEESGIDIGEDLPPKMPLLGETSARLSLCSSNLSLDNCSNSSSSKLSAGTNRSLPEEYCSLGRSKAPPPYSQAQLRHRPSFNAPPHSSFSRPRIIPQHSTLAEAVKSFQSGEDANVLRKLCQNAWDSLERRKNKNNNNDNSKISHSSSDAHITAV